MMFSKLYNKYITVNNFNIFSSKIIKIPMPQYYVFYNGKQEYPDRVELKLSDAFHIKKCDGFEWTAVMLNINYGKNKNLMDKCKILRDYAILVEKIRKYQKEYANMEDGVAIAVEECIREGVMSEFLLAHKAEVIEMCLTEYNEEETMALLKKEAREEAWEESRKEELIALIKDGLLSKEQVAKRLLMSVEQLEKEMENK